MCPQENVRFHEDCVIIIIIYIILLLDSNGVEHVSELSWGLKKLGIFVQLLPATAGWHSPGSVISLVLLAATCRVCFQPLGRGPGRRGGCRGMQRGYTPSFLPPIGKAVLTKKPHLPRQEGFAYVHPQNLGLTHPREKEKLFAYFLPFT